MISMGFPGGSDGKESTCNAGDLGLIPGLGRYPWGGQGNPLQCPCLENFHGQRSLGGLQVIGPQRVEHDWATKHCTAYTDLLAKTIYNPMTAFVFIFGSLTLYTQLALRLSIAGEVNMYQNLEVFSRSGTTKPESHSPKVTFTPWPVGFPWLYFRKWN